MDIEKRKDELESKEQVEWETLSHYQYICGWMIISIAVILLILLCVGIVSTLMAPFYFFEMFASSVVLLSVSLIAASGIATTYYSQQCGEQFAFTSLTSNCTASIPCAVINLVCLGWMIGTQFNGLAFICILLSLMASSGSVLCNYNMYYVQKYKSEFALFVWRGKRKFFLLWNEEAKCMEIFPHEKSGVDKNVTGCEEGTDEEQLERSGKNLIEPTDNAQLKKVDDEEECERSGKNHGNTDEDQPNDGEVDERSGKRREKTEEELEAERVEQLKEAEKEKQLKEAERIRQLKEAEKEKQIKEAERIRLLKATEKEKQLKAAERIRQLKEAEREKELKEAERIRKLKEEEKEKQLKEAERIRQIKEAEKAEELRKAEEIKKAQKEKEEEEKKKIEVVKQELLLDMETIEESKRASTGSPSSRPSFAQMFLWAIKKTTTSKQLEIAREHRIVKDGKVEWKKTHFILAIDCSGIE